ncbi:hypothetical protein ABL78_3952 [Leptomonas seymouri]|uniref:Uncharacterized protein n=1 Tax=Leptomonas seymouri TaxID=5684 RepID=A0A0N1HYW1_LEPSE|nr:hypothetical protein ABL78_3952 [Leptomonas seymouri]|eukprot:KPI86961.1 hypothetical protein ABL78_3952 [Leptomonas seymouri]
MSLPTAVPRFSWDAAIHLSDADFTSRIDFADAYVLPTFSEAARTAVLVSPWLLTSPRNTTGANADLQSKSTAGTAAPRYPQIETVPLAWRCLTCGNVEVEQLYWRRPSAQQRRITSNDDAPTASSSAALRASLARKLRLQGLSPAMKAKLERHRRRRERREEMRWHSLHVSRRCRQCVVCPRCGGNGSVPRGTATGADTAETTSSQNSSVGTSRCPPYRTDSSNNGGRSSVLALDIRLTRDMRYFTVCPCCQWHSYQAFPSMEQLIFYLDNVIGEDKAEVMRDWRNSQRSANTALRSRLHDILRPSDADDDVEDEEVLSLEPPKMTISQAAWERYTQQAFGVQRHAGPNPPRSGTTPRQGHKEDKKETGEDDAVDLTVGLHPAVALEALREREAARRASALVDQQTMCVPPGAVQVMRVWNLAQEAWAYFSGEVQSSTQPLSEVAPPSPAQAAGASEVALIAHTQQSIMGLRAEAVDTRRLTLHDWMQRYQPAAVIAQQRKAAAAANKGPLSSTLSAALHARGNSPSAFAALLSTLPDRTPAKMSETPMKPVYTTPMPPSTRGPASPPAPSTSAVADASPTVTSPETRHSADYNVGTTAATPNMSALYHTPTSAYLQSLLQRERDRALGLPAYCVPRGRKELLTGLVWRPTATDGNNVEGEEDGVEHIHGSCVPCTCVVVLDRPALPDSEVQRVYEHWSKLLQKQAERRSKELQQQLSTPKRRAVMGGGDGEIGGGGGNDSEADEDDVDIISATGGIDASGGVTLTGRETTPLIRQAASSALSAAGPSARKRATASLPPPLFRDGADFAAASSLPCWRYIGSTCTRSNGRAMLEWRFHLVNLSLQHDLFVKKLSVHGVSVHRGASVRASSSLELLLSSAGAPTVQLPVILQSRCSPEERAVLASIQAFTATTAAAADSKKSAAHSSHAALAHPPPSSPQQPLSLSPQQSAADASRLRELLITMRMPAEEVGSDARGSSVYVAVAMEMLTPLPDASTLGTLASDPASMTGASSWEYQYYAVNYGVTVLLTPS